MTKDEALRMALMAFKEINKLSIGENAICLPAEIDTAMDAIKEASAQPEQEPDYWLGYGLQAHTEKPFEGATPVWTKPQQPKEPEQEPVAIALNTGTKQGVKWLKNVEHGESLYTTPPQRKPLTEDEEFSNGFALALHDAVLIRIGKNDEATRQATARIDKLVSKYKDEAAHGIKDNT